MQPDLFTIHEHESNYESQTILNHNRRLFSADCKRVFDLLISGERRTIKEMDVDRSRISDLKRNGVLLSYELNENRYKIWKMSPEEIEYNKKFLSL